MYGRGQGDKGRLAWQPHPEVCAALEAAFRSSFRGLAPTGKRLLVAVSGYGRDQDRAQALQAGFDLHFTKPADPEQLLQVLARHRQGLASPHQN